MYQIIFLFLICSWFIPITTFAATICRVAHRVDFGHSVATKTRPVFLIKSDCLADHLSPKISHQLTIRAGKAVERVSAVALPESTVPRHWEVLFDLDRTDLDSDDITILRGIPAGTDVRVDGYTCQLGSEVYNEGLSYRRATVVANALKERGVNVIIQEGQGECCPVSESNLSLNRRVIIVEEKQ